MNIFACHTDPILAARHLPDKHVVKMPIENAQMLAVALGSEYGNGWGNIRKKDGTFYKTRGFRNHPCSLWVRESLYNLAWTIQHGIGLCLEYSIRYGKDHGSLTAHHDAIQLWMKNAEPTLLCFEHVKGFARAMPEYIKLDDTISDVEAYRKYLVLEKPWAKWKIEDRKPTWWDTQLYTDAVNHGIPRALQDGREV